ncbi:MAG: hypothetical protein JXA78_08410 [Anaerolineales bacterium]|nr:hypothetical protein [Anaerolineales bacterium]
MEQNETYLKILSIFHFVVAGMAALFACFPIFHLAMGITMLTGGFFSGELAPDDTFFPFTIFGLMFTLLPAAMIVLGWAFAISLAISGYFLSQKRKYTFCLVMAGVSCVFMPFGTVLGAFTIGTLIQPAVKALFNANVAAATV